MAAAYNDGSLPYGALVVTINSIGFVAEQIDISRPTKEIERNNQLGEPSGSVLINGRVTGTATLQLASGSVTLPTNGLTFPLLTQGVTTNFVISDVGTPISQDETYKVVIGFKKYYN